MTSLDRVMNLVPWGRNLNAFNDILRGGFGTPEEGFVIRWNNHAVSKQRLGYTETARFLGLQLERCHPANQASISKELEEASAHRGQTVNNHDCCKRQVIEDSPRLPEFYRVGHILPQV